MNFGNIITAMVTPFNEVGEIDFQQTTKLINYLISHETDSIIVSGTTGESPTLTFREKVELFQHAVEVAHGRIPILAGTGSNCTQESIELSKEAESAGVDGLMLVTPYYNRPNQRGLYEHFTAITRATELPVMLYDIPGRSAVHLELETVLKLAEIEQIVAIKDASGDLSKMSEIIEQTPSSFDLYSGDDPLTLPVLSIGGKGVVSVASHVLGSDLQKMVHYYQQGEINQAAKLHRQLLPMMKALFFQPSPAPVKKALHFYGVNVGGVRLPLVDLSEEETETLKKIFENYKKNAS